MALLEQALAAYLTAALPAVVIEPNGGHLSILGELVEAEVVDDVQVWDPDDVVDAEVVEEAAPPAPVTADQSDHALLERLATCETAIAALHSDQVEVLAEFGRRRAAQFADEDDAPLGAGTARTSPRTSSRRGSGGRRGRRSTGSTRPSACPPVSPGPGRRSPRGGWTTRASDGS